MDVRNAARRVMAGKLIADAVREQTEHVRQELLAHMTGSEIRQVGVRDDQGQDLGTVYVGGNRGLKAVVTDEAAFLAWVRRTRPDDVVETVRESTRKALLDAASKAGVAVDTTTGEVIPGVELVTGDPYLAARPTAYARELMADTLSRSGLLALPGGTDAA